MIKFSIIVPVYNVEQYLEECFNSLLNQTYSNYELIIVCDKCSDDSEQIVDKYVKKHKNFSKIYAEHTGLGEARNIGIKVATGDYLLFVDSDDYLEKDLLKNLDEHLTDNIDVLRFQVQDIADNKIIKHEEIGFEICTGNEAFNHIFRYHYIENSWCYVYSHKFWKKNKFKFMKNCIAEDYGLTPLVIAKAKTLKSISYIGYNYRQRENSLMTNTDYNKKIKKMDDMLLQSDYEKEEILKGEYNPKLIEFLNNSLIYYSTTLKYKDYRKYNKILKKKRCFEHLKGENFKGKIKIKILKMNSYIFYRYVVK
ncbi:MAG: glycosyltransferase family 2 protein [Bacilli bacterium]|nr:glycosyltransferase family 2 protein [Bacilli bacterium]